MSNVSLKTREDIEDFVRGCTFFGTGGGGKPEDGIQLLTGILKKHGEIRWKKVTDLEEEGYSVCPFLMGSIAPWTEETFRKMEYFGLSQDKKLKENLLTESVKYLSKFTGKNPKVIVPIELGGSNTPAAITAAYDLGIDVVDGDYVGRAIPEIEQTTPYLEGYDVCPISSIDIWGNVCYIEKAVNLKMAERIGKFISAAGFGIAGQAGFLIPVQEMKQFVVKNTLSECYEVGKLIRESREKGEDVFEKVANKVGGRILFKGVVSKKHWEDKEGYYWGYHEIEGKEEFKNHTFKIWFKNENHISWLDGKEYVTSPDMLVVMKKDSGDPLYNPVIEEGMEVVVIGVPARKEFLTEKGIEILGPAHFGFDIKYKPFEALVK